MYDIKVLGDSERIRGDIKIIRNEHIIFVVDATTTSYKDFEMTLEL